ncbi:MAG TPA: type II secretion system protein [Candidatus Dormibacteraeota bacterium]|nr:type II secretion system protein [Candidatus Dormibacteraeota bacterium]
MHKQGLYGWFNKNLRGKQGQQGFTLIELLVVVTILGVLAAIVTLSLVGLTTKASENACNAEYKTVQAAVDAYMANGNLSALPGAQTAFTQDMTGGHPLQPGQPSNGTVALFNPLPSSSSPNFTRNGVTQFFYTWDVYGKINGIGSTSGGAAVGNCVPH